MTLPQTALEQLFLNARTANGFLDKPVPESLLQQAFHGINKGREMPQQAAYRPANKRACRQQSRPLQRFCFPYRCPCRRF